MTIDVVVAPMAEVRLWVYVRRVVLWRSAIATTSIRLHLLKKCMLPLLRTHKDAHQRRVTVRRPASAELLWHVAVRAKVVSVCVYRHYFCAITLM